MLKIELEDGTFIVSKDNEYLYSFKSMQDALIYLIDEEYDEQ